MRKINALAERAFLALMNEPNHPIFLAKFIAKNGLLAGHESLIRDADMLTVVRRVQMKPEQPDSVPAPPRRLRAEFGRLSDRPRPEFPLFEQGNRPALAPIAGKSNPERLFPRPFFASFAQDATDSGSI